MVHAGTLPTPKSLHRAIGIVCLMTASAPALAQSPAEKADKLQAKGIELGRAGKIAEAEAAFTKAIEQNPYDSYTWFLRGISKGLLDRCSEAILDYDKTLQLDAEFQRGYLERGSCKMELLDDAGALADFTAAIELDSTYAEAYYNRGLLLEMTEGRPAACPDLEKAHALGLERAKRKVEQCADSARRHEQVYAIRRLERMAPDDKYGLTPEQPVKVGNGPNGGPANQRAYLDLLRDAQGEALKYERQGSCCGYPSANTPFGVALVDRYEVSYRNAKGKPKKTVIYISMYDYEEPLIPQGFTTVPRK